MKQPRNRWRHPLFLPGIGAGVVAIIALWVLWMGIHESDPSYGMTLLREDGEGGMACFVIALAAFELSFVTLPFPVPRTFSPPYLRVGSGVLVIAGIVVGGRAAWDLVIGPAHAQGPVTSAWIEAPSRSYESPRYHVRVAGIDFNDLSADEYRGATAGTCVKITYGPYSDTITTIRLCSGGPVAVAAPAPPAPLMSTLNSLSNVADVSEGALPSTVILSWTAANRSDQISILDARTGTVRVTIPLPIGLLGLAVDPQHRRIFVGNLAVASMLVLDGTTGHQLTTLPIRQAYSPIVYSPATGRVAAAASIDLQFGIVIADTASSRVEHATALSGFDMRGTQLIVAARGKRFYMVNNATATAYGFDAATGVVVSTTQVAGRAQSLVADDATEQVFVTDDDNNQILVLNALTGTVRHRVPVGASPQSVALDAIERRVYAANSADGTLSVIDSHSDAVVRTVKIADGASWVADDPARHRIFVVGGGSIMGGDSSTPSIITVLDSRTLKVIRRIEGTDGSDVTMLVDQATGNLFLVDNLNGRISMLNAARL